MITLMGLLVLALLVLVIVAGLIAGVVFVVRTMNRKGASSVIHSCPSRDRWREWLDGRLAAAERSDFAVHLEGCLQCQRTLDDMAGADRAWSDLGRQAFTAAPPEPGFARALNDLKSRQAELTTDSSSPRSPGDSEFTGKLNGYEILGEVGRGGMGVVLKAFDPKLRRVVAIKVLAPHLAANAAARERFLREARAAAAVAHEHVVTIHSVEESTARSPYIVMQFVPGRSLQERLDQTGPMKLPEILRIGMQAASGLAAAHAQGLVHRDIKPANILLENGVERVKLADFGLARAGDDASLTRSGVITGSPQFMSPEQARGETADFRSDLFGLGCVLYAMCAGHPPFRASTPLAVLKRVCEDTPRSLREVNSDVPDWLEAIVFKLLAKDPADRFESAAEVADLLGQHLRHLQQADAPMPPPVKTPGSARPQRSVTPAARSSSNGSTRLLLVVLLCVGGLLLICCGAPALMLMFFWGRAEYPGEAAQVAQMNGPVVTEGPSTFPPKVTARMSEKPARAKVDVMDALTNAKSDELAAIRTFCTIESVNYDPKTHLIEWKGKTLTKNFRREEAEVNLGQFAGPVRFFDKDGRLIKAPPMQKDVAMQVELGQKLPDGSFLVFFKLQLSEEILKNAISVELSRQ